MLTAAAPCTAGVAFGDAMRVVVPGLRARSHTALSPRTAMVAMELSLNRHVNALDADVVPHTGTTATNTAVSPTVSVIEGGLTVID